MPHPSRVMITGASTGIGAVYADRFAKRGHSLVLVARDEGRLDALAARLRAEYGIEAEVLRADLTDRTDLARVEARLDADPAVGVLINNAGAASFGAFAEADPSALDNLIQLNVTAATRLAHAAVKRFLREGGGALVNISSILATAPEYSAGIYAATKAYMLTFSQSLATEFGPKNIYVQAVLPAATRTEIWERAGRSTDGLALMTAENLVDAALLGFDRRETVTLPSLADADLFDRYEAARKTLLPNARTSDVAARYRG